MCLRGRCCASGNRVDDFQSHNMIQNRIAQAKNVIRQHPMLWSGMTSLRRGAYGKAIEAAKIGLFGRSIVVSYNELGVSNRIKCLLSSMRLASALNRHVVVHWPRNWACRCDFEDLFENIFVEIDRETVNRMREQPRNNTLLLDTWGSLLWLPGDLPQKHNKTPGEVQIEALDFEYSNTHERVRNAYAKYAKLLRPNNHIQLEVKKHSNQFSERTISVSIRSWKEVKERADGLFDIRHVFCQMDKHDSYDFL